MDYCKISWECKWRLFADNTTTTTTSSLEVPPSQERCAMCESQGQLSSSYVVNLMIFQPFLLQHTQKPIKLHNLLMKLSRRFLTRLVLKQNFNTQFLKYFFNIFNQVDQPFCCCFSVSQCRKCLLSTDECCHMYNPFTF